jgi:hypothetical protein
MPFFSHLTTPVFIRLDKSSSKRVTMPQIGRQEGPTGVDVNLVIRELALRRHWVLSDP